MRRGWFAGVLLVLLGAAAPTDPERVDPYEVRHRYVGARKCKTCHGKVLMGDQVSAWRQGIHVRAFETLRGEESLRIAKERGLAAPPHESSQCLRCHITAYGVKPRWIAFDLDPLDGVQCESCHGPGKDFRVKEIMSERDEALEKGLWDAREDERICTVCHNPESPTWDPERYTLADGKTAGFSFEQAKDRIHHPIPEHVKGRYLELEEKEREERKARGE